MLDLIKWKNKIRRQPLLIEGARQVGKTWLMQEFGQTQYKNVIYVNFDDNNEAKNIFKADLRPNRIIKELEILFKQKIDSKDTLIIFDEIQEANTALRSLKYFCEDAPQYNIVSAGSLLGVAIHKGQSFPVGKVDMLKLYPLTFAEFLYAIGEDSIIQVMDKQDWQTLKNFSARIISNLKYYYYVGGMPKAVLSFVETNDLEAVRHEQSIILSNFENDFSKHITTMSIPKTAVIWNSIPKQLAKENKKFMYKELQAGARAAQFEDSLYWLEKVGLVHKILKVCDPLLPLIAYSDQFVFKLFTLDIGLLSAKAGLELSAFVEADNNLFKYFKGALTEQFVLQELKAAKSDLPIYYWTREKGLAEIDFIIQYKNNIIPIEAKSAYNTKAKSLKNYIETYNPNIAIRTSLMDYGQNMHLYDIPLYMIGRLNEIIDRSK
ncbi:MAG: ATP-binding protein [Elusimicrobiota bacterium]|nr:ATP-binding protein [Elusimicrobiota bacterium]